MSKATPAKQRGRKPASVGQYGTQDAIWHAIRELRNFTSADLICHINRRLKVNDSTVESYLQRLRKGGYLSADKKRFKGSCAISHYTLEKDTGVETPCLRKDGSPSLQGRGREQLWRSMKILKAFDWDDLCLAASTEAVKISKLTAKEYVQSLHRAGYLSLIKEAKPGTRARYRFLPSRNTGPRPPQVQRVKRVYDPNLDKVMWQGGDQ